MFNDLGNYERSVHSQSGEDGVIQHLFELIGTRNRFFVEFGAGDGLFLSNTAHLRLNHGWTGLLMEGSEQADGQLVRREFVSAENINFLFAQYDVPEVFDLLSVDIDGNDYWVWNALTDCKPRLVVVEYNIFFGLHQACTVPYEADRIWDESYYHGASLGALEKLGITKGYTLVHTDSWAPNAFFVLNSELPAGYRPRPLRELTPWNSFVHSPPVEGRPWVDV